jgi:hypothetical protein
VTNGYVDLSRRGDCVREMARRRSTMRFMTYLRIVVAAVATVSNAAQPEHEPAPVTLSIDLKGKHGFDFLDGEWRARHRKISGTRHEWVSFEGTVSHRALMAGTANIEEYVLNSPDGAYRALNLRAYDQKTDTWSIWWLDQRYPDGPIGPPVQGRFANGIGTFYAEYEQNGKQMRMRYIWSDITPQSARWQRAISADQGKTWESTWFIDLERSRNAAPHTGPPKRSEFAFLDGEWRVLHRYLRAKHSQDWVEASGTVSHHEYHDGWANVEDYVIERPGGRNHAVALRSFNPKDGQWSIWWLDGRDATTIEAPMKGRFVNGIGTFDGITMLEGKPTSVRFTWSETETASPRWEQSYSYDEGRTWEKVWIMQFRRGG